MKTLLAVLMAGLLWVNQLTALNPPGAPASLSGLLNGQQNAAWGEDDYCSPQGTWIGPATDGPSHMPINCMYTPTSNTPANGKVWGPVHATSLAATYGQMACGDRVLLYQGESAGQTSLPPKGCDDLHWIWIKSTGVTDPAFPAEGSRVNGCVKGLASMPGRLPYNCPNPKDLTVHFVAPNTGHAMVLPGTDHIRFIGIDFTRIPTKASIVALVDLTATGTVQTNHIIFDRSSFSGVEGFGTFPQTVTTDTSTTRGLYLAQSNHIAVIGSAFWNFYDNAGTTSNGNTDAQCVAGGFGSVANSGWGVYKFVNNSCEGGSEGIILGGAGGPPKTPAGCTLGVDCNLDVPVDIEVRENYFAVPLFWNGNTTTINYTGWPNRKNCTEFKSGARILYEGNVCENGWYGSQPWFYAFDFAPKNQMNSATDLGSCPSCLVQDGTVRHNYGYNVAGAQLATYTSSYVGGCAGCGQTLGRRLVIHDNLWGDKLNRGSLTLTGFDGTEFLASAGPLSQVVISHNTWVNAFRSCMYLGANAAGQLDQFTYQDNICFLGTQVAGGIIPATASGCDLSGYRFLQILTACINGTTPTWTVDHNGTFGAPATGWPPGNLNVGTPAAVGFVNYNNADSGFNPGNYQLIPTSSFHNAASDGRDVGANIPALLTKIAGVRQ